MSNGDSFSATCIFRAPFCSLGLFLDAQASLAPTLCIAALYFSEILIRNDIVVANMVADMLLDMVADMEVDKMVDMVTDMEVDTILTKFHNPEYWSRGLVDWAQTFLT